MLNLNYKLKFLLLAHLAGHIETLCSWSRWSESVSPLSSDQKVQPEKRPLSLEHSLTVSSQNF
jgi:hypothetical protein